MCFTDLPLLLFLSYSSKLLKTRMDLERDAPLPHVCTK